MKPADWARGSQIGAGNDIADREGNRLRFEHDGVRRSGRRTDKSRDGAGIDLETSVGYLPKETSSALRAALEQVLRPLGMTVTHYSCLELLAQRPGLSNSDLARGAFVTRQSMNVLLQGLEREGSVTRPAEAPVGRVLPAQLTPHGRRRLEKATVAVRSVEDRMLVGLTDQEQAIASQVLRRMVRALQTENVPAGRGDS